MTLPRILAVLFAPLFLAGCLLLPGAFESAMTLDRNGDFTFTYVGEIRVGPDDDAGGLTPPGEASEDPDDFGASMNRGFEDFMREMMGGLDPRDDEQVRAFAARLEQREGWNRVDYRGEGVFDVDYAISGNLTHDFVFPVVPDFLLNFPMVAAVPRDDGTVMVKVPALMPPPGDESDEGRPGPGTFVLRTDAVIVSSNAAAEALGEDGRRVLRWESGEAQETAPEAVIRLGG
ncbi:MAG: hypothetical protein ABR601_00650 [Parasphingopyxis sp.]